VTFDPANKENVKKLSQKQKMVIPKNMISFQPPSIEKTVLEKPRATIVRKVYVKRSREFVQKVAAQGAEETKLKKIMLRVHDTLNELDKRAMQAKSPEITEELFDGHSSKTSLKQLSIPSIAPDALDVADRQVSKQSMELLEVLTEIAESCNNIPELISP